MAYKSIAARAGQNVKISSIKLGGSDAFIVLADADLEHTIKTRCAAKRFIVVEAMADKFLEKFRAALAAFEPGNPLDPATTLGPLPRSRAARASCSAANASIGPARSCNRRS